MTIAYLYSESDKWMLFCPEFIVDRKTSKRTKLNIAKTCILYKKEDETAAPLLCAPEELKEKDYDVYYEQGKQHFIKTFIQESSDKFYQHFLKEQEI